MSITLASVVLLVLPLSGARVSPGPTGLSATDLASLGEAYRAARHAVLPAEQGFRACNPAQRWRTTFDGEGFVVEPDAGEWTWGLELVRWGFDGAEIAVDSARDVRVDANRVTYDQGDGLEEWYVNDSRGLEHGYTIHRRPPGGTDGALVFTLAVRGGLEVEPTSDRRGARFSAGDGASAVTYGGLVVRDADGRELAAWIERAGPDLLRICLTEGDARYPITVDPIAQQAYLKASNAQASDLFGRAVAASGDTVVVGAPYQPVLTLAGGAYVFVRNGTVWTEQAFLKASNATGEDYFGWAVTISGDTIAVGAPGAQCCYAGMVYIYERSGSTWSETAILAPPIWDAYDLFGTSVSLSGDTLAIGAYEEDSGATGVNGDPLDDSVTDSGAAYVYVRNGSAWSQEAYLKASHPDPDDHFGWSVHCSGDTVVVGAYAEDSQATGIDGDPDDNSMFDSGAAYVFERTGSLWAQRAYLKPANTGPGDKFGWSVACSGDVVLVGAPWEDSGAWGVDGDPFDESSGNSGAAWSFERVGTTWIEQAYFKASNTGSQDEFGYTVSIDGDDIVIGAPYEDSGATGVDGDQNDDGVKDSGAAYVFRSNGLSWSQAAYLKASNTQFEDNFALAAAVSDATVLVGAHREDSGSQEINGDQDDNSAGAAGAAYVFGLEDLCGTTYCGTSQNPANAAHISIDTCDSASPSITLGLSNGPQFQFAYLLVGDGNSTISQPPGSNGDLCVAGGSCLGRFDTDSGPIGTDGKFTTDIVNALSNPCGGLTIVPGSTWNFQFWHRQPMGQPSAFSAAISVTFD